MALIVSPSCPEGVERYIGAPTGEDNIAPVVEDSSQAAFLTAEQWGGTVFVTGLEIVPGHDYIVRADCGLPGTPAVTAPTLAATTKWGDVSGPTENGRPAPPDGKVDVLDIATVVDGVKEVPGALPTPRLDLFGCVPNRMLDVIDVAGAVDAVKGRSYQASSLCPLPCP
jgi:hypothetical protein